MVVNKPNNAASAYSGSSTHIQSSIGSRLHTKTNWALTCWATTKGTQGLIQHRISNFSTLVLPDEKKEFTASALLKTHGDNLN
jgi:hypothetical protein|tara:strand:+ start:44 stop:292 length:249 start_codon:yes stop_codon:yes gene_type:complete